MTNRATGWLASAVALLWTGLAASAGFAATFVVTTTGDTGDTNTADNSCVASGGGCTLRAAIQQANATAGTDVINFGIGTGPRSITPGSALPSVTGAVTIDGRTQPFAAPAGISLIGTSAGAGANGLVLAANGCAVYALTIRNFSNHGIAVNSANNTIAQNHLGTDAAGTADQGNGAYGLAVTGSTNTIGGPAASYADRNVISGNDGGGLLISGGSGNLVQGNFIGVDRQGMVKVGNGGSGVFLSSAMGNTFKTDIISGNAVDGVHIVGGGTNTFHENTFIGLNNGATAALNNGNHGVYIESSNGNTFGPTDLISGNTSAGVYITGATATGNVVFGNFIGLGYAGGNPAPIGNGGPGVILTDGANNNTIGGLTNGTGNIISANSLGVLIRNGSPSNRVVSNVIGIGGANASHGVEIIASANNVIGIDSSSGSGNLISGNGGNGVSVTNSNGTVIAGDTIGADGPGTAAIPNLGHGVALVGCSNTIIGGDTAGEDNEIAGNAQNGVYIVGGSGNQILNNAIGIDGNGEVGVANGANGILLQDAVGTFITTVNVSGNTLNGLRQVGGSGTTFRGNYVGTNLQSTQAIPNGGNGISLELTSGNFIGEPVSGGGNIIAGSGSSGISLFQASNNVLANNIIGVNANATIALPNAGYGILLQASNDNTIGGPSANRIASNGNVGIAILSGQRNSLRPNMVYLNGGLGIDLDRDGAFPFDGVTFNDPSDADTGANGLLNAPTLTAATTTTVSGRIKTTPNTQITVDLYRSTSCDPAGFGEASAIYGSTTVTTNASGVATWLLGFAPVNTTDTFAATATDPNGNSSEYSQCISPNRKPVETLAVFNTSTGAVSLIATLTDPLSAVPGAYTTFPSGAPAQGKWVVGDWNADGIDTPGVYANNGVFYYTNDVGTTGNWSAVWFGLFGKAPAAGRFNPAFSNDCLAVVDSTPSGPDTAFALYYICNLASPGAPSSQWLSLPLANSQGFAGTHQFVAGDFDGDGVDSMAVRRSDVIAWTNVAPSSGHALFNLAQYIGVPAGASGEGNVVVGDWDGDGLSSFGLYYQDGTFQRRNDLIWNSGVHVLQRVGQTVGTPTTPESWRPGGSAP